MNLDLPPQLILPDHYEARRPAIIRPDVDPGRYFPVGLTRGERRAIVAELRRAGRLDEAFLPGMVPVVSAGAPSIEAVWIDTAFSVTNASSFNFGNFTAPAGGLMVVLYLCSTGSASNVVSSISIGGTVGTLHAASTSSGQRAAVASREVSAGAQNVTVTHNSNIGTINIISVCGVWLLKNYTSASPVASTVTDASNSSSQIVSMNMAGPGVALYGNIRFGTAVTSYNTAIERHQAQTTASWRASFADKATDSAITPHPETLSWSSSGLRRSCGGSWG